MGILRETLSRQKAAMRSWETRQELGFHGSLSPKKRSKSNFLSRWAVILWQRLVTSLLLCISPHIGALRAEGSPHFAEWYNAGLKDKMEVIFVSSDRDQASFDSYFGEMPWQCLPYANRDPKALLSKV